MDNSYHHPTNEPTTASIETLSTLHNLVAEILIEKLRSGEATAMDVSAAIRFLKDNGIEAAADNPQLQAIIDSIPDDIQEGVN